MEVTRFHIIVYKYCIISRETLPGHFSEIGFFPWYDNKLRDILFCCKNDDID